MVHKQIRVEGRVQGVWYRDSTCKKANALELAGTVKNLKDGAVFIEVEGDEGVVGELVAWLYEGPEKAEVSRIIVEEGNWKGFDGFQVLYE